LDRIIQPLTRLLVTLWAGSLWVAGYLVAPILFDMLDSRALAGGIAGRLFSLVSWIGLFSGVVLVALWGVHAGRAWLLSWRAGVVYAMLVAAVIGEFGILPMMQELRQTAGGEFVLASPLHQRFSNLHRVSSALFMFTSLSGLILVLWGAGLTENAHSRHSS
jgi:hypothetical protein